ARRRDSARHRGEIARRGGVGVGAGVPLQNELRCRAKARCRARAGWTHCKAGVQSRAARLRQSCAPETCERPARALREHLAPAFGAARSDPGRRQERKLKMPITSVDKDPGNFTLTVVGDYPVTQKRLWDAYADPRQLERFWGPVEWLAK